MSFYIKIIFFLLFTNYNICADSIKFLEKDNIDYSHYYIESDNDYYYNYYNKDSLIKFKITFPINNITNKENINTILDIKKLEFSLNTGGSVDIFAIEDNDVYKSFIAIENNLLIDILPFNQHILDHEDIYMINKYIYNICINGLISYRIEFYNFDFFFNIGWFINKPYNFLSYNFEYQYGPVLEGGISIKFYQIFNLIFAINYIPRDIIYRDKYNILNKENIHQIYFMIGISY